MEIAIKRWAFILMVTGVGLQVSLFAQSEPPPQAEPVKVIFDTDIGSDIDDALALAELHTLQSRGRCELLAVTVTKPDELAGPFVDVINTFYGRPHIPIGCMKPMAINAEPSKYLKLAEVADNGVLRYPHSLKRGSDAEEAVKMLRRTLASQPDHSVVIVQVGLFSNLAALLDSAADGVSPLTGRELIEKKVKLVSLMAGWFPPPGATNRIQEYNVVSDLPAAKKVCKEWPTPMAWSGGEIGVAVRYPAQSIERDFNYVAHHPVAEAYYLYNPPPHERPCWDLTSVLYAVLPDRGYFDLSPAGEVTMEADGVTRFSRKAGGRDRYLILKPEMVARVKEALVQLVSQPPNRLEK